MSYSGNGNLRSHRLVVIVVLEDMDSICYQLGGLAWSVWVGEKGCGVTPIVVWFWLLSRFWRPSLYITKPYNASFTPVNTSLFVFFTN